MNGNRYFAEGIATFALVFAGCGTIVVNESSAGAPVFGTYLAHPTCRWIQGSNCCTPPGNEPQA